LLLALGRSQCYRAVQPFAPEMRSRGCVSVRTASLRKGCSGALYVGSFAVLRTAWTYREDRI